MGFDGISQGGEELELYLMPGTLDVPREEQGLELEAWRRRRRNMNRRGTAGEKRREEETSRELHRLDKVGTTEQGVAHFLNVTLAKAGDCTEIEHIREKKE